MGFKIEKISTPKEALEFKDKFCELIDYDIPFTYFLGGECYTLRINDELAGGYCLVSGPLLNLRSARQVPFSQLDRLPPSLLDNLAEFTGYFVENKLLGFLFTAHLVWTIFWHRSDKFIYSYPVDQKKLEAYYGKGDPVRIYTGVPNQLEGHTKDMDQEHVEIVTKYGILKIFLHRTWKYMLRSVLPKRKGR